MNWFNFKGEQEIECGASELSHYHFFWLDSVSILSMIDYKGVEYHTLRIEDLSSELRIIREDFKSTFLTEQFKMELHYKRDSSQNIKNVNYLVLTFADSIYSFSFDFTTNASIQVLDDEIIVDLNSASSSVMYMHSTIRFAENAIQNKFLDLKLNSMKLGESSLYCILISDFRFSFYDVLQEDFEKNESLKRISKKPIDISTPKEIRFSIGTELAAFLKSQICN